MIASIIKTFVSPDGEEIELTLGEYDVIQARDAVVHGTKASYLLENSPLAKVEGTDFQAIDRTWIIEAHMDGFDIVYLATKSTGGRQVWRSKRREPEGVVS